MEKKVVYLDLKKVNLKGHEREKSDLVIDSIVRGIEAGDEFPAAKVIKLSETEYELVDGHYRAIGHYIANRPVKCMLIRREPTLLPTFHVGEMILVDDSGEYFFKKLGDNSYR